MSPKWLFYLEIVIALKPQGFLVLFVISQAKKMRPSPLEFIECIGFLVLKNRGLAAHLFYNFGAKLAQSLAKQSSLQAVFFCYPDLGRTASLVE